MTQSIEQAVQEKYASVATSGLSSDREGVRGVEGRRVHGRGALAIPAEANMGVSCGNPTAFARLKSGRGRWWTWARGAGSMCSWRRARWVRPAG